MPVLLGVLFHFTGGFASGSFYICTKKCQIALIKGSEEGIGKAIAKKFVSDELWRS